MYVQSNTLLLADPFENFWVMCLEIYDLDTTCLLAAPGLRWQAVLKKINVKLELLTDIDMLLMVEKAIRGGIFHTINQYAKLLTNTWKIIIKIENRHIFNIGM